MKTKAIVVSGFLGSGKTTLIKKYLDRCLSYENIVVIENEFGEVSIDSQVLSDKNLDIYEINNGCICCTLLNDFEEGLESILEKYKPDKIIIEPSGVAKVSDIVNIIKKLGNIEVSNIVTVVNAFTFSMNFESFGAFYKDQIKNADVVFLTRVDRLKRIRKDGLEKLINKLEDLSPNVKIIYGENIDIEEILDYNIKNLRCENTLDSGDISSSQSLESCTFKVDSIFEFEEIRVILDKLINSSKYGLVIRSKGILKTVKGYIKFDYVDGEINIENIDENLGTDVVVIGSYLDRVNLYDLFENKR